MTEMMARTADGYRQVGHERGPGVVLGTIRALAQRTGDALVSDRKAPVRAASIHATSRARPRLLKAWLG